MAGSEDIQRIFFDNTAPEDSYEVLRIEGSQASGVETAGRGGKRLSTISWLILLLLGCLMSAGLSAGVTYHWYSARNSDKNECSDNACLHGATCEDGQNEYRCLCVDGYEGKFCEIDYDECASDPCLNGATCLDGVHGYSCLCDPGYEGPTCSQDKNECSDNACLHGATCEDGQNEYHCLCVDGYEGKFCEIDYDECAIDPCLNGATCLDGVHGYSCLCDPGYEGPTCSQDKDECDSNPCPHGATCVDGTNSYNCLPESHTNSGSCIEDGDSSCGSDPCPQNSFCVSDAEGQQCLCAGGFAGEMCDIDVNECASHPCIHGGTCVDDILSYRCRCLKGYQGYNCENDTVVIEDQRLVTNTTAGSGRLEILVLGRWGSVCGLGFYHKEAKVACRQLGYSDGAVLPSTLDSPEGGIVWLDNVHCNGQESRLENCSHGMWGNNYCLHVIGLSCYGYLIEGIRLANGTTSSGRLEILYQGGWGTVCDDAFNSHSAKVACRQLGFLDGSVISVPDGKGPIWLDQVDCTGSESRLEECGHIDWGVHDCSHSEDVGLQCYNMTMMTVQDMRLAEGTDTSGRLELLVNGQWGTICDVDFGMAEATVSCKQLGLQNGIVSTIIPGPVGAFIWLDDVSCIGSEDKLEDCVHSTWGNTSCRHSEDVAINCEKTITDMRLVGGANRGRIEVLVKGEWGTVCDDLFNDTDAHVACRQLGYSEGRVLSGLEKIQYELDTALDKPIWMDDINCQGTESILDQCPHNGWSNHNCGHEEDVEIHCYTLFIEDIRLSDGTSNAGRLEILYQGRWGTVCGHNFGNNEATAACRQLGYSDGSLSQAAPGPDHAPVWMNNVQCAAGDISRLEACTHDNLGENDIQHTDDVGVNCYN